MAASTEAELVPSGGADVFARTALSLIVVPISAFIVMMKVVLPWLHVVDRDLKLTYSGLTAVAVVKLITTLFAVYAFRRPKLPLKHD